MSIEKIHQEWEQDSILDETDFAKASLDTVKLHSKYLKYLSTYKVKYAALTQDHNLLRQAKYRYYRGELSKDELLERNWKQWQGVKPIKSEAEELLSGDQDLNNIKAKLDYTKIGIDTLEAILKELNGRAWVIKNIIDWKKFISGA